MFSVRKSVFLSPYEYCNSYLIKKERSFIVLVLHFSSEEVSNAPLKKIYTINNMKYDT